jgi:3-oxoadipate enol-lactonase
MKLTLSAQQEMSYHESGRGDAVILVHAFPLHRGLWSSTIRALSSRYHVLAPDLVGFGDSPLSAPAAISIDHYGDALVALCEEKKLKRATFVGCSMGGYILFALHKRYPGLFRGLVLVDTRAAADSADVARTREESAARVERDNPPDFYEAMLGRLLGATTMRERPGVVASVRRMMSEASPHGVAAALRAMAAREDATSRLPSIHTPTLVVVGEEDQLTPPEEAKRMAAMIPNSAFVTLSGAGHLPSIEAPEAFQRALLSFLSSVK